MEAALFLNGEKADVQAFIQSIVTATVEAYKQATNQKMEQLFVIDPERVYSLADENIAAYLGCSNLKNGARAIAAELRRYGFEPWTRSRRNGLCAPGQMILDYLKAKNKEANNFKLRAS